jgi:hypothetical protein
MKHNISSIQYTAGQGIVTRSCFLYTLTLYALYPFLVLDILVLMHLLFVSLIYNKLNGFYHQYTEIIMYLQSMINIRTL